METKEFDRTVLVAIDFDGTLTKADDWPVKTMEPDRSAMYWAREMAVAGAELVLWTCREGSALQEALDLCFQFGVSFRWVNRGNGRRPDSRKVNADVYIDDRAVLGPIDWPGYYCLVRDLIEERKA